VRCYARGFCLPASDLAKFIPGSTARPNHDHMKLAALLPAFLLATPAIAADPTFGGFAYTVAHYSHSLHELPDTPVTLITIGDFDVVLETTEIAAVAAELGGEIHHQGEAGEATTWLCYTRADRTFWFYSDGEMGDGKVNMVAVEDTPGASDNAGCSEAPRAFDSIDFGIRAFGDWMSVMQTFGKTEPTPEGIFGYTSIVQTPVDGGGFHVIAQDLVYRLERDHITAIAVLQVSEN
jgi:hypothetical protein